VLLDGGLLRFRRCYATFNLETFGETLLVNRRK
jgi:hypothetical protein